MSDECILRRLARGAGHLFGRRLPGWAAVLLGFVVIALPVVIIASILWSQVTNLADSVYGKTNDTTAQGATEPTSSLRSGGPGSLVTWDSLGMQGRNFTGRGPDAPTIQQFTGVPSEGPIRVYAGVESAPTAEERAQLAVKELDRTDAWSREVLCVMGTTGTGWIEPQSSNSLEYLWHGDTAEVTIPSSDGPGGRRRRMRTEGRPVPAAGSQAYGAGANRALLKKPTTSRSYCLGCVWMPLV